MITHVCRTLPAVILIGGLLVTGNALGQELQKTRSSLYGPDIVAAIRRTADRFEWAGPRAKMRHKGSGMA